MMTSARLYLRAPALLSLLFVLVGCSSIDENESAFESSYTPSKSAHRVSSSRAFPVPSEIEDNVAFWENVYGNWSRGQVAIHDDEYMGVIYEVTRLPGYSRAGYTSEQNSFVRARKAHYQGRLASLEDKVRSGQSPSSYDKALYDKLVAAGGQRAIYGASERVRVQRGLRERFRRGLEISGRYDDAFREIFRSHGLPEDLAYLPHVESSFQAHARSSAGAAGMWQFTRGAGKRYMTVNHAVDERLDPVTAAEGAARYLGDAYRKLNSWPLAVTSYNHGQGGMAMAKATYGNDIGTIVRKYKGPHFKFASRNFYAEFLAAREVASHPSRYFPEGVSYHRPLSQDRLVLRHSVPADHVAHHYGVSSTRLAELNRHWTGARGGRGNLPAGSTVWLPGGTLGRVAGQPEPKSVVAARAEPDLKPSRLVEISSKPRAMRVARVEPMPKPKPIRVAKVSSKPRPIKVSRIEPKLKPKSTQVERVKAKPKTTKVAKAKPETKRVKQAKTKSTAVAKVHVVKPNETLYRVSTYYDVSVDELRRLNRMGPDDNNIRIGQRLRVSG